MAGKPKPAPKPKETLTPRQLAFAHAYARCGVAETAAIEAGYSKATARGSADRLLANAGIRTEVDRLLAAAADKAGVTVEKIAEELTLMGFSDLAEFVEWGFDPDKPEAPQVRLIPSAKLDAARRRAIVEVSQTQHGVRIKLADKSKALELLGRYRRMFDDPDADRTTPVTVVLNMAGPAKVGK